MYKKIITTAISILLVITLCLQIAPLEALAYSANVNASIGNSVSETYDINSQPDYTYSEGQILEATDDTILYEAEDRREESVKHFVLADRTMVAAVYSFPVHELDENENWVEIDNTLTSSQDDDGESAMVKQTGKNKVSFANKAKEGKLLTISTEDGKIYWSLNNISGKVEAAPYIEPEVEANNTKLAAKSISGIIAYNDILPNVNLEYQLVGNDIKENIILKDKSAVQAFSFTLVCKKMTAQLENNRVVIYNADNEIVRIISAPYMTDSANNMSDDIILSLEETNKGYTVTVLPNEEWLLDENRVYPVVVDPDISTSIYVFGCAYSANPESTSLSQSSLIYVGRDAETYGNMRSAIKISLPGNITESDMIIKAHLIMTQ